MEGARNTRKGAGLDILAATVSYIFDHGRLEGKGYHWTADLQPGGHQCLGGLLPRPHHWLLRLSAVIRFCSLQEKWESSWEMLQVAKGWNRQQLCNAAYQVIMFLLQ